MSTPETVAVQVVVSGRVQGVFFRDTCARLARSEGVAGWIRNRADGRVEARFQGEAPAVDKLVTWCREGSRQARVSGVVVTDVEPAPVSGFRIE